MNLIAWPLDGTVQTAPFNNPFLDELTKYPIRFAVPIFFGESPHMSNSASLNNGTCSLLKLHDNFFGVTCWHVLNHYRCLRTVYPNTFFQVGACQLDPDSCLISESRHYDLAILNLNDIAQAVGESRASFFEPTVWPPRPVAKDDLLAFGGFPGFWREQLDLGYLRFYSFSSGTGEVLSISEDQIVTALKLQESTSEISQGKVWGSIAGVSGGPVFVWRKSSILTAELVGFMYEYSENLDLLFVRVASLISANGTLI